MIALVTVTTSLIIRVFVIFVIIGLCAWLIDTYVPMPAPLKIVFRVLVALLVILWLLSTFGIA